MANEDDPLIPDYHKVAEELRQDGAKTHFQNQHQLVVATAFPYGSTASNSFWLRFHNGSWHLVTWAPTAYRIPRSLSVVQATMTCLRASTTTLWELPEEIVDRLHLQRLTNDEAKPILLE